MARPLRALAAFPWDPSSIPTLAQLTRQFQEMQCPLLASLGICTHMAFTTQTHINNNNKNIDNEADKEVLESYIM